MSNWEAFAKDAAVWVDRAGGSLFELVQRHGVREPNGDPVVSHYVFAVLEGVVAGFEARGFQVPADAAGEVDEPASFGPIVNWFGARAAVDTDQAPASGPVVNGPGLAAAAGDPWDVALAPALKTIADIEETRKSLWAGAPVAPEDWRFSVRETFARPYDTPGGLSSPLVTADQGKAIDALREGVTDDDDVTAWADVLAGTGVDPGVLQRHARLVKSVTATVRAVGDAL